MVASAMNELSSKRKGSLGMGAQIKCERLRKLLAAAPVNWAREVSPQRAPNGAAVAQIARVIWARAQCSARAEVDQGEREDLAGRGVNEDRWRAANSFQRHTCLFVWRALASQSWHGKANTPAGGSAFSTARRSGDGLARAGDEVRGVP